MKVYPITIVMDRYGGCYSGANWIAYNMTEYQVSTLKPSPHDDGDGELLHFWRGDGAHDAKYHMAEGKLQTRHSRI